jgi:FMN phosphatase YigB (HAD superfamily)
MKEYILKLKDNGVKAYLATNNEKYRTEYLWNVVGIKNFLEGLFSSCYLGYMKPEVEYWQEIYKVLNKYPKENILVLS